MTVVMTTALLAFMVLVGCSASTTVLERPDAGDDADGGAAIDAALDVSLDAPNDTMRDVADAGVSANAVPSLCVPDGFCWMNPRPFGYGIQQLAGTSSSEVWALGIRMARALLRFDGERWDFAGPPPEYATSLTSIAVDEEGTLWATGAGPHGATLLSFDGHWRRHGHPRDYCRQLVSGGDLGLFCRTRGGIERFRGGAWAPMFTGTSVATADLWPAPNGDLWAVGDEGTALRYDGHRWVRTPTDTRADLRFVFGTSNEDVWAIGAEGGPLLHFDGTRWQTTLPTTPREVRAAVAGAPDDAWIFANGDLLHWDGVVWSSTTDARFAIRDAVIADDTLFAAGDRGALLHFEGGRLHAASEAITTGDIEMAFAVEDEVFLAAESGLLRWDGTALTQTGCETSIRSIWGTTVDDLYLVGAAEKLWRWDGTSCEEVELEGGHPARHVCGTGPDNIWVVGNAVWHFDGASWTAQDAPIRWLTAAVTSGPGDLWVIGIDVGHPWELHHFDGDAWTRHDLGDALGGEAPYALAQEPRGRLWVASRDGHLAFFEAGSWHETGVDPSWGWVNDGAMPMTSLPDGGVIITGQRRVLRFDGETANTTDPGVSRAGMGLLGVAVSAAGDVVIVGSSGAMLVSEGGAL